jgi:hypothetical protein
MHSEGRNKPRSEEMSRINRREVEKVFQRARNLVQVEWLFRLHLAIPSLGGGGDIPRSKLRRNPTPQECALRRLRLNKPPDSKLFEEHVGGTEILALAVVQIQDEVVLGDEIARMKTEKARGLINGSVRAFQFDEGADGSLVVID